jgi:hypothetical protein
MLTKKLCKKGADKGVFDSIFKQLIDNYSMAKRIFAEIKAEWR